MPHYLIEALIFGTILLLTIFLLVTSGGLEGGALGQILPTLGLYAFAAYRMKPAVGQIYQGFSSLQYGRAIMDGLFE
ncbi:MAG: ABC transporter ATP-binding protein, partial [Saprospiraceae bacterium]